MDAVDDHGPAELQLPQVLTAAEVAAVYRIAVHTVYTYARDGRLRSRRIGNRLRFLRGDVEAFLAGGDAA
jgi:excisionase family DNA binding protein